VTLSLRDVMPALQGVLPSTIGTCARDGMPNISYVSHVHYVDERHVAVSRQFFNKTRSNLDENPQATAVVIDPPTVRGYRLRLRFERSETSGALFDFMAAHLRAIAAQSGMEATFQLISADVFEVLGIERMAGDIDESALPEPGRDPAALDVGRLRGLRQITQRMNRAADLDGLLGALLPALDRELQFRHTKLLLADEACQRLFVIASHGYEQSGVGSEVRIGEGLLGAVAQTRQPLRIASLDRELRYARSAASERGVKDIPLPGLARAESCLVQPLLWKDELVGVLAAESEAINAFSEADESVFGIVCNHAAGAIREVLQRKDVAEAAAQAAPQPRAVRGKRRFCLYRAHESLFVDGEYLSRYVPAQILWRLLRQHTMDGRVDFTNRELRMDASLALPAVKDNLEARLILLRKRLEQKCPDVRIVPTGRGRFRLDVACAVELEEREAP
jgi:hypothetical protein